MAKRNWPDHPAVGLTVTVEGVPHVVVDAKAGKMYFYEGDKDFVMHGTIVMRVKPVSGGAERWLPPTDGKKLCEWAEKQKEKANVCK